VGKLVIKQGLFHVRNGRLNLLAFQSLQQILLNIIDKDRLLLEELTVRKLLGYIFGRCWLAKASL